jgi:hypothetical protein
VWLQAVTESGKKKKKSGNMEVGKQVGVFVCVLLLIFNYFDLSVADNDDKNTNVKKKLQIGVKKRVDNCQVKSKRGDFLHMHYKVSVNQHSL